MRFRRGSHHATIDTTTSDASSDDTASDDAAHDQVIDLTEALDLTAGGAIDARAEAWASRLERQPEPEPEPELAPVDTEPGDPGHCPACFGPGYLDVIDARNGRQIQHCRACDHRWSIDIEINH